MAIDPQNPVVINIARMAPPVVSDLPRKYGLVVFNASNIGAGKIKKVYASDWSDYVTADTDSEEARFCAAYFAANASGTLYLFDAGEATDADTLGDCLDALKSFIDDATEPVYFYHIALPEAVDYATAQPKLDALFANWTSETSMQNFSIVVDFPGVLTATLPTARSAFIITEEAATKGTAAGSMVGTMSGSLYAISQSNMMTPFQYKKAAGAAVKIVPTVSQKNTLTEKNINWIGAFNGFDCVMLGKYANGDAWDYRFSTDNFVLRCKAYLEARLYNGANVPSARLPYNQRGIDMLLDVVNGQGDYCVSVGFITEYGESLADDGATIINPNTFYAIPYAEYIAANQDKYAQEIYDGISGVVRVGRYFRQVVINATLV